MEDAGGSAFSYEDDVKHDQKGASTSGGGAVVALRRTCPPVCDVCGDAATGYHYQVPSCNGCKTFFRRTVTERKRLHECKLNGECFNGVVKIKCRVCRFARCIEAGMNPLVSDVYSKIGEKPANPDSILSEADPLDNPVIRDIIEKKRKSSNGVADACPIKMCVMPAVIEYTIERIIESLAHVEICFRRLRSSKHSARPEPSFTLESVLDGPSLLGTENEDNSEWPKVQQRLDFTPTPIEEMLRAKSHEGLRPFPPIKPGPDQKAWHFVDILYSVEYLKTFDFFHALDSRDKRVLSRKVALQCTHLSTAFYSFEQKSDVTLYPDGQRPFAGRMPDSYHDYQLYKRLIVSIRDMDLDKNEYLLLKALLVCDPAVDGISAAARKLLGCSRERYAKSLLSYTVARRGTKAGPAAYAAILTLTDVANQVSRTQKDFATLVALCRLMPFPFRCPFFDEILELPSLERCPPKEAPRPMLFPGAPRSCSNDSDASSSQPLPTDALPDVVPIS